MPDESSFLRVESLGLKLGKFALRDISLGCDKGQYHILLGPTGSGKSTLMKCILGFHKIDLGRILLKDREIQGELPERRNMGYVPQNYGLFPHLNVEQNLRFGLGAAKVPSERADARIDRLARTLGIEKLRPRSVRNLSGGEKQKVALGRALATEPEVILLDEPFSSVDEGGKRNLWLELKQIADELGITIIHITHNLDEAYTLGEKVSVLIDGRLAQTGSAGEIFEHPASESVARYLGYRNIMSGVSRDHPQGTRIEMEDFHVVVGEKLPRDRTVEICVRGQDIKIIKEDLPLKDDLMRNVFSGTVVKLFQLSDYCLMWFKVDGSKKKMDFELKFPRHIGERYVLRAGDRVRVAFWEPKIIVL